MLIAMQKADKADNSYRHILLLNIMGKLMKQLIVKILKGEIEESGGLAKKQHG